MLQKLKRLLSTAKPATDSVRPTETSGLIDRNDISHAALTVIETLQSANWQAYLVGGGVRDLLLSGQPKDFDVATDATPEQVQSLFRRARVIGRRFKIVHVRVGREIIEVTTFRGSHTQSGSSKSAVQSQSGILLRDNVYGDLQSDALRRDFSVNALYYDPSTDRVIDYCDGLDDIEGQTLKMIGDPAERYKEDPVRMLRAVRFQAKLGFNIEKSTEAPIKQLAHYLGEIPPARLFEETLKLFLSGHARATLESLNNYGLLQHLFPSAAKALNGNSEQASRIIIHTAENTDQRLSKGKRVTPAFIFAAFLWPDLWERFQVLKSQEKRSLQELLFQAADEIVIAQQQKTAIPKRFLIPMREIWALQLRLTKRDPKRAYSMLEHNRFRAAYDFLLLREQSGEALNGLGDWWTRFQFADQDEQSALLEKIKGNKRRRSGKRSSSRSKQTKPI
jgi:poly(A) polymerase